jgi:hypothetical protein
MTFILLNCYILYYVIICLSLVVISIGSTQTYPFLKAKNGEDQIIMLNLYNNHIQYTSIIQSRDNSIITYSC